MNTRILTVLLIIGVSAVIAQGQIYSEDFEGATTATLLTDLAQPWSLLSSYSPTASGGIAYGNKWDPMQAVLQPFAPISAGALTLQFKAYGASDTYQSSLGFYQKDPYVYEDIFNLTYNGAAHGAPGFSTLGSVFGASGEAQDEWVDVTMVLDLDNDWGSTTIDWSGGTWATGQVSLDAGLADIVDSLKMVQYGAGTGSGLYIDDIVLTPEPATMILLGLGGLLGLRRRK